MSDAAISTLLWIKSGTGGELCSTDSVTLGGDKIISRASTSLDGSKRVIRYLPSLFKVDENCSLHGNCFTMAHREDISLGFFFFVFVLRMTLIHSFFIAEWSRNSVAKFVSIFLFPYLILGIKAFPRSTFVFLFNLFLFKKI